MTDPETESTSGGRSEAAALAAVLCVAAFLHAPDPASSFVYDDHRIIETNPRVTGTGPWTPILTEHYWGVDPTKAGGSPYYRPLFVLTLRAIHAASGTSPFGFHLASLAMHLVSVGLLWHLGRRVGLTLGARTVAAAVFAMHPITVQAVSWASSMSDPMAASLGLASLLCVDDYVRRRSKTSLALAALAYGSALLTLERAALFVVPAVGWAWASGRERMAAEPTVPGRRSAWMPVLVSLLLPAIVVGLVRLGVLGAPTPRSLPLLDVLRTLPSVLGRYGRNLVVPTDLAMAYPEHRVTNLTPSDACVAALVCAATMAGTWLLARNRRVAAYALASAAALFAPALLLGALPGYAIVQDRYLYAPLAFLALVLGDLVFPTRPDAEPRATWLARGVLGTLALGWLVVFPSVRAQYANDRALYEAAVANAPGNANFLMNLSNERSRRNAPDDDCALLRRAETAIARDPSLGDRPLLYFNLGNCHRDHGRADEALTAYARATELTHGEMLDAAVNATLVQVARGRLDAALAMATTTTAQNPRSALARRLVAFVHLRRGEREAARADARRALELAPDDAETQALVRALTRGD